MALSGDVALSFGYTAVLTRSRCMLSCTVHVTSSPVVNGSSACRWLWPRRTDQAGQSHQVLGAVRVGTAMGHRQPLWVHAQWRLL